MFFSKSIPISKFSFDHKKSIAKNQCPERKEERLPGRNFECGAKKGRNIKPNQTNQTTAPKSRKKRKRAHKGHCLD
jgi:hypothetical protein